MKIVCFLFALFINTVAFSNVTTIQTDSFADINNIYEKEVKDPKKTLLVFDIDDTLLTMTQPLGGVGWWDWQAKLLSEDATSPLLFANNFRDLIKIQNILFQLINMEPTDKNALLFINQASQKGATLLGLTARGPEHENATENELKSNQFLDNDELVFKTKGLKLKNDETSTGDSFQCGDFKRFANYTDGILYLSGQNKGKALRCILNQAKSLYTTILFVDDTYSNNQSMEEAFKNDPSVTLYNIWFTREREKENAFLHSSALKQKAFQKWTEIRKALRANIDDSIF
jgi:hypothetical protein